MSKSKEIVFVNGLPFSEKDLAVAERVAKELKPAAEEALDFVTKKFPGWRVKEFYEGFSGVYMEPNGHGGWWPTYGASLSMGNGTEVFIGAQQDAASGGATPWVRVVYESRRKPNANVMIHFNKRRGVAEFSAVVYMTDFSEERHLSRHFKTDKAEDLKADLVDIKRVMELADYLARSREMSAKEYVDRASWDKLCAEFEARIIN